MSWETMANGALSGARDDEREEVGLGAVREEERDEGGLGAVREDERDVDGFAAAREDERDEAGVEAREVLRWVSGRERPREGDLDPGRWEGSRKPSLAGRAASMRRAVRGSTGTSTAWVALTLDWRWNCWSMRILIK